MTEHGVRNIGLAVSYDGTRYNGFQTQPGGNTIQDKLEEAIAKLTGERVKITGSGRTDAGVHARKQVVHVPTSSRIPADRWCLALNALLPKDIVVFGARDMPPEFHARRSARRKTYVYAIRCARFPDVFERSRQFHHPAPLDIHSMQEGLQHLVGTHDYTSFCSTKETKESKVRTIFDARIDAEDSPGYSGFSGSPGTVFWIRITGSGFLYNMVRIIVGTLIEIGEGKRTSGELRRILLAKDRTLAGPTAMAHALTLWDVDYGEEWSIP